ncbi:Belongs to the CD36 [Homalodisca vitripennis]|nr:Belongs to the CD36 [Homalodisca vitripennis]
MEVKASKATIWLQDCRRESKKIWSDLEHKNCVRLAILSIVVLLAALFVYLVAVPTISRLVITRLVQLKNDSDMLSRWLHQPEPFLTKIYLWNVTNAVGVITGLESPAFSQVGPYVYEQFTEKIPIEFKKDSIVYMSRTNYRFRKDLTEPASLDDIVVTLNVGLYGAAILVESFAPSMVSLINDAVPTLFPGIDSILNPVRVGAYLFDGILLHCADAEGTAAMVCNALPEYAPPTIRKLENSSDFAFSFLAHKINNLRGPYEENRGMTDIMQVGNLMKLNNKTQLGMWQPDSQCDQLHGSDTQTFPPFLHSTDSIAIFISDICQVLSLYFENEDYLQGLLVYKFILSEQWLNSVANNTENSCYCLEGKDQFCHYNGVRDISQCMKAPVVMSLPHFYLGDPEFRNYARGMRPHRDLHTSALYIEPQTGTPVKAAKRIQFNMNLRRIEGFHLVQNISEGLFPLVWMEESGESYAATVRRLRGTLGRNEAPNESTVRRLMTKFQETGPTVEL